MIPYLAPELLSVYLRCRNSGGRQSAATSIDGKPGQREAGLLFEFIRVTIEPLNRYLATDLHRRPLSASRLARFALSERRRIVRAAKWRQIIASEKKRRHHDALNP
jgi:plasmid replication initiation protein